MNHMDRKCPQPCKNSDQLAEVEAVGVVAKSVIRQSWRLRVTVNQLRQKPRKVIFRWEKCMTAVTL